MVKRTRRVSTDIFPKNYTLVETNMKGACPARKVFYQTSMQYTGYSVVEYLDVQGKVVMISNQELVKYSKKSWENLLEFSFEELRGLMKQ